jgi:hypothetical protein
MIDNNESERRPPFFQRAWAAWCRFWFRPADPTPLCLMRIVAGLLTLYVHVAYTFDLQALFGADGWYPTAMADRERREWPVFVPQSSWGPRTPFRMPANVDYRHALRVFLENLANQPERQDPTFRLLGGMSSNVGEWMQNMEYLRTLPRDPVEREDKLRDLINAPPDPGRYPFSLPPQIREKYRLDAHELAAVLPIDPKERRDLFDELIQEGPTGIDLLQSFLNQKVMKQDPAKRSAYLEYTEYWSAAPDDEDIVHIGHTVYSPFYHVTSREGINILHGIHLAVIVLFTLGVCTRVTSVMTWLAGLAYIHRNPLTLFGQDTMMNLCLFYLMFAPCGATWSVDWLVRRYRAGRDALAGGRRPPIETAPRPLVSANVVIRLLQVQYCIMYLSAGLSKLKGNSWWNGTAPWYCFTNPEFSPLHIPFFRYGLVWLCQDDHRWLFEIIMSSMSVFTIALEIGLPFLIWTRLRPVMIIGAILLHTGIALNMGLVVFSLFMFTLLLAWMTPDAIRRVFARPPSRLPKVEVRFNAGDRRQRKAAAAVYAADVWHQAELTETAAEKPVEVVSGGVVRTGVAAATRLVRDLALTQPVWWLLTPLMRLPGLSQLVGAAFGGPSSSSPVAKTTDDRKRPKAVVTK